MLTGWRNQQLARRLAFSNVEARERMVRAFAAHSQHYPWSWSAQMVDEWMTDLRAVRGVRASTLGGYQSVGFSMTEALPAEVDLLVVGAGQAGLGAAYCCPGC